MPVYNGDSGDNTIFGSSGPDELYGGAGNDLLAGEGGADLMAGGPGDDRIVIDNELDSVVEFAGEGNDTVITSVSYTLAAGVNVEILDMFQSAGSINLTGNELSNTIYGNESDNIIIGGPAGGLADRMVGGGGSDTYYVNNVGDVVEDNATSGLNRIYTTVSFTLRPLDWIGVLAATDPNSLTNIDLTGNDWAQSITGNAGNNILNGLGNEDILSGGGGNDRLNGGGNNDALYGGTGNDLLFGDGGNDTLLGDEGDDLITGGDGIDSLTGGSGDDIFSDTASGFAGDTISDFSASDKIIFTNATFAGFTFSLSGSTLTFTGGSLTLTGGLSGQLVASAAVGGGVQLVFAPNDVRNDFNGDGRSDILWRNASTGQLSDWLGQANGGFVGNDANAFATVPISWSVVGTGDFNGDGRDDVLWRNSNGQLSDWLGTVNGGFTPNDANAFTTVPTSWSVVGTGDFNGDGRDDVLWRNTNGQLSDWLGQANGGFVGNDANAFTSVPTNWHVAGVGDFNGDGRDDILWRNDAGQLSDWLGQANGGFVGNDANAFGSAPTSWHVVGTGDFNGDGRDDILWRSDAGQLSNWLGQANGGFVGNDANAFTTVPTSWTVVAIGDYNGDGRDDILWRNSNGQLSDWLGQANGGFVGNDANASTTVPIAWHVQPEPFLL